MIEKGVILRDIASATNFGKSSIGRHKLSLCCRFSFSKWKAAKVKTRRSSEVGRLVVSWPEPDGSFSFTLHANGEAIALQDLEETDVLIAVSFAEPKLAELKNLRAIANPSPELLAEFHAAAIAEDLARASENNAPECPTAAQKPA